MTEVGKPFKMTLKTRIFLKFYDFFHGFDSKKEEKAELRGKEGKKT